MNGKMQFLPYKFHCNRGKTSSKVILNSFNINVNIVLICNDIWLDRSVFI